MKVGTDGVLLGCWAELPTAGEVLDVGAGCGLVALCLAQRFAQANITALEIDENAAQQAAENVAASPFAEQVKVACDDFLQAPYPATAFSAIVSNPPFFQEDLIAPNLQRARARHTAAGLTFEALIARSAQLLASDGSLQVIVPTNAEATFHSLCNDYGFTLRRQTLVHTTTRKPPKRSLLHFQKGHCASPVVRNALYLMEEGRRSSAYQHLCRDFYL